MVAREGVFVRESRAARLFLAIAFCTTTVAASDPVVISGSGSTFIQPLMSQWIDAAAHGTPEIRVVY